MVLRIAIGLLVVGLTVSVFLPSPTRLLTQLQPAISVRERLDNYNQLLDRLEKRYNYAPVENWPEVPRQLWHDTVSARDDLLKEYPQSSD